MVDKLESNQKQYCGNEGTQSFNRIKKIMKVDHYGFDTM